jgi:flagellin-like hook-associated protein FlgL
MNASLGDTYLQVGLDSDSAKSGILMESKLFDNGDTLNLFKFVTADLPEGNTKEYLEYTPTENASDKGTAEIAKLCAGLGKQYTAEELAADDTLKNERTAAQMLEIIDNVINRISGRVTTLGAASNRIQSAIDSIGVQSENILSSLSTLRDADVAEESSNYLKAQILQQASATLLATANQQPSIALNLL